MAPGLRRSFPTSRPGRSRPRRAGAPGLPWLRDPGWAGCGINSRPRGCPRLASRTAGAAADTGSAGPGGARPLRPGLRAAGGGSGPAARGGERPPLPDQRGGGGGDGWEGGRGVSASLNRHPGLPGLLLPSSPFRVSPVAGPGRKVALP